MLSLKPMFPAEIPNISNSTENMKRIQLHQFPDSSYVGWLTLMVLPSILLFSLTIAIGCANWHRNRIAIERRKYHILPFGLIVLSVVFFCVTSVWNSFDLVTSSICYIEKSNCSHTCGTDPVTEYAIKTLSWRPLITIVSVILCATPLIIPFIKIHVWLFCALLIGIFGLCVEIVAFFKQSMCGEFFYPHVCNCTDINTAIAHMCSVPVYNVGIWLSISAFLCITLVKVKSVNSQYRTNARMIKIDATIDPTYIRSENI